MRAKTPLTPQVPSIVAAKTPADEELLEEVALPAVEVAVAAEPRVKVCEVGFAFADNVAAEPLAAADGIPPTGTAAAEDVATADMGSMRLAVELTPGMLVPGGMSIMFEVDVAFKAT
jgi:hypothetical protein